MDARKRNIVMALMVAMFLGAVEGTVVTTAMPTIAKVLSGFELISWVFSLYLLTSAISTPIYGKLADLYGRKNVLSIGIMIFLLGSSLCGISQNMYQLIAFRGLQGLGAGAIFTVSYTIVGDIFTLSERAKVQGWISSVWGVAGLAGPFLGGFLIDTLSWHWIFFINIPFGIMSVILIQRNLDESFERKKHIIDILGTITLSAAIIALLYGLLAAGESGSTYLVSAAPWLLVTAVLFALFFFIEKRAQEPIIPFEIFTRTNTLVNAISFLASAVLIGMDVYLPVYIQNVLGFGATVSGLSIAPMSVSWLLTSIVLGKAIPRYGERAVIIFSGLVMLFSTVLLLTLGIESPLILVILYCFIVGFGFGGALTTLTIVVQSSVGYDKRGAATASNSLLRTVGQTIGVSAFGGLLNLNIVRYFEGIGIKGVVPDSLYSTQSAALGISALQIKSSVVFGLRMVFIAFILLSLISLVFSVMLPPKLKSGLSDGPPGQLE